MVERTNRQRELIHQINGRRWNQLILAVNDDMTPDQIKPELNEGELFVYQNMQKELARYRKTNPKAAFSPVEYETDDEGLDVYHEEAWKNFKS